MTITSNPNSDGEVSPELNISAAAAEQIAGVIQNHQNPVAGLKMQIQGRSDGKLQHSLSLVEQGAELGDDLSVEVTIENFEDTIEVFYAKRDAFYLNGLVVDWETAEDGTPSIIFKNPNPLWRDNRELTIYELFEEHLNPQLAQHGGMISLLSVEENTVYVEFGGGCVGCGMLDVTLKQGVETAVKEFVPEIEKVVDVTDHQSGDNPYYKPSKK
jgi:Fe/S biogenesis protein NfuA